jgi:hypothetical protein
MEKTSASPQGRTYGTLKELNVKPGDVVQTKWTAQDVVVEEWMLGKVGGAFKVISRAREDEGVLSTNERSEDETAPKTWGEMSDAEKGELLLDEYNGEVIEVLVSVGGKKSWRRKKFDEFYSHLAYRRRPEPPVEPKRETVTWMLHYIEGALPYFSNEMDSPTHKITFETLDGVPVLGSEKMEEVDRNERSE